MAREDRPSPADLSVLAAAADEARRWEPFALLRTIEARTSGRPRLGRARRPADDAVEIVQDPAPGFAPAAVLAIVPRGASGGWRIVGRWFGLLGSMGPMPLHLSEYAAWEARYAKQRPFGRFLDVLARRMQHLFYRAWAEAVPAAQADRPDDDRFATYIARLSGVGEGGDGPFPASVRLAYASLFASRRSAIGIEDALGHLLGTRVRLLEYQRRHRELEPEDRTRLGRQCHRLGHDATLGHRVMTVTDAFRVVVRAPTLRDYRRLLPGGDRHGLAVAALDAFSPSHLEWDIALEIDAAVAPAASLDGRAQLGWTSWIGPAAGAVVRRDTNLRRTSERKRAA